MNNTEFLNWLHQAIPLTAAMQIDEVEFRGDSVRLSAPLEPNINDKGTGFAGSISGLATLCGWTLLTLWLRERGIEADVMIAKSEQRYIAPVKERLVAEAVLPNSEIVEQFWERFRDKGRARLPISVTIGGAEVKLELFGDYVAVSR